MGAHEDTGYVVADAPPEVQAAVATEQAGDAALQSGDPDGAFTKYGEATTGLVNAILNDPPSAGAQAWAATRVLEMRAKGNQAIAATNTAESLLDKQNEFLAEGNPVMAARYATIRGELLTETGQGDAAVGAYRDAVTLARSTGTEHPFLLVTAYGSLLNVLPASPEKTDLARELSEAVGKAKPTNPYLAGIADGYLPKPKTANLA